MAKKSEKQFLEKYNIEDYERPSVTSDIVIFSIFDEENENNRKTSEGKLSILLIRRNGHPFKDDWALPGGFLHSGETIEDCALRELEEETMLSNAKLLPTGTFSKPGRDPRGWIISNAFMAPVCRKETKVKGGDDAAEAVWFTIDSSFDEKKKIWKLTFESQERSEKVKLSAKVKIKTGKTGMDEYETQLCSGIAFDHSEIILQAFINLRKHIESDNLAYEFLPKDFTILQLQKVYELVLDHPLLAANFRRKISAELVETGEILEGKAFRPAKLYRRK